MDYNQFEEDGNDSDLEARLYAEIYYSNETHDPGENFEDSIKCIQDIKNASIASNETNPKLIQNNPIEIKNADNPSTSSDKNCSPTKDQTDLVSAEKEEVSSHVDKNLNLQKQVNLETQSNSIPREDSNENVDENVNSQETPDKNRTPKQKTPKQKKNQTPKIMNEETENSCTPKVTKAVKSANKKKKKSDGSPQALNNSLNTPNSRKRTLGFDNISGGNSKRRSLESDKSLVNSKSKSATGNSEGAILAPVSLNGRKSSGETNISSLISPATMAILFPPISIARDLQKGMKKKKSRIKTKTKAANLKDNSKQSEKAEKSIQEEEIIEIVSSDSSSDSSDDNLPIVETPKVVRQKQNEESEKEMPMWLDVSSDSDESIFEVPVPPKPPPPLIDLNDSENVSSDSDDSSSDGIHDLNSKSQTKNVNFPCSTSDSEDSSGLEDNSRVSKKTKVDSVESCTENLRSRLFSEQSIPTDGESSKDNCKVANETPEVISINNYTDNSVENSEENVRSRLASEQSNSSDEASDSSYSDFSAHEKMDSIGENLILNCTQVQKGAKSLEEIKKLRQVAVSAEEEGSENVSVTEYNEYVEPLNDLAGPSTSKASGSVSKKKSRKKKESEKSRKSSKEKTDEEYFFEPMSDKIKAFYNDSWGGEEFSVEETQNKMRSESFFRILGLLLNGNLSN